MTENTKIKVNDLPGEQTEKEIELPVLNEQESKEEKRGGHSEGGCCGACGG